MRKLSFAALILLVSCLSAKAQNMGNASDSTAYQSRKLKKEEVNFVTGYYQQDGNNAAVLGGIGDEHLTDVATTYNISLAKHDKQQRKHSFKFELGVDIYTSASSDKIDANTVSSASNSDARIYPSLNYNMQDDKKGYGFGSGFLFSREFDYTSYGGTFQFSKLSKDRNSEFTAKASAFFDEWKVILPLELRPPGYGSGAEDDSVPVDYKPRNTYNLGLVYSRVINRDLHLAILADFAYQEGLLGTRFHRVFFNDGSLRTENLPDKRTKIPVGLRASYFVGDNIVLRGFYRYYWDNWDIKAHTASLELSYKFTPFFSVAPFYRFYHQSAAEHFAPYKDHDSGDTYYTSDYDLSEFNSHMVGVNTRFSNLNGKSFFKKLNTLELRYSYYKRSTGLYAHSITVALNFKQ